MGKLRIEPKTKQMGPDRYREILSLLEMAQNESDNAYVFYDLDASEDPVLTRKEFLLVAEREEIHLAVRLRREQRALALSFSGAASLRRGRIPSDNAKQRILDALAATARPMRKGEIIAAAGINAGTWNPRITELLKEGRVVREGLRRESVYSLT